MLYAVHGDLDGQVGSVDDRAGYSRQFIPDHEADGKHFFCQREDGDAVRRVLQHADPHPFPPCLGDGLERIPVVRPRDGFGRSERGFRDLAPGGRGRVAGEVEPANEGSVGGPEHGSDVVEAPDVVEHPRHRVPLTEPCLAGGHAPGQ